MANKRLYKSQDRKLCGVCSGIAEYFNIDPTIVRLIWVVATCVSVGAGLIAYIVCALVMPDRPSSASDWDNMKRANDNSEQDREFNSHFEKK
ncbi:MAG TPA: PspC domain-containing protein [Treponema sp.]|nr:PspC domain-containing protein [Treponema sp.]